MQLEQWQGGTTIVSFDEFTVSHKEACRIFKQSGPEDVSTMGGLGVHSFSLFNFLGFNLRGLWWCSYSTSGN